MYVFMMVITFGVLIAIGGVRLLRSPHKVRVLPPERVLMSVLGGNDRVKQLQVLGRMRVVVGAFLVVIGIWAMT
jgi:hypothetical protein